MVESARISTPGLRSTVCDLLLSRRDLDYSGFEPVDGVEMTESAPAGSRGTGFLEVSPRGRAYSLPRLGYP